jgi:natural product biosynthesis luciferase-like monooxygenase protein
MKFGIFSLPTYFPDRDGSVTDFYDKFIGMLQESEREGFDIAWVNEHHFHRFGGMIPSPAVLLAALSMKTSTIRIGTSVSILSLHHPLELAESYAMVDQLSKGRLVFGVGRGFAKYDYNVMDVPFEEGQDRLNEYLEIILKAWTEQPFSYSGKYYNFKDVEVWPTPHQKPHPPIWGAATRSAESFARIGEQGFGLMTVSYIKPLDELGGLIKVYRDNYIEAGHNPNEMEVSTHFQVYVEENGEKARQNIRPALERYLELSYAARALQNTNVAQPAVTVDQLLNEGRVIAGSPAECIEQLERAREKLNFNTIDCTFYFGGLEYEKAYESFKLFSRDVIPYFKKKYGVQKVGAL